MPIQKDKYCAISLMWESKKVKLVEADSKMVVAREKWVREIKRCLSKYTNFHLHRKNKFWGSAV